MKTLFKLLFALVSMVFLSIAISSQYVHVTPFEVFMVLNFVAAGFALLRFAVMVADPSKYQVRYHQRKEYRHQLLALGVAVEFWDTFIASNLYKTYEWLSRAKYRSGNVLNSTVVHIPQAGAVPSVQRNRSQYPIPVIKRSDSDITYVVDELSSDTTLVKDAEKWELSYVKAPDILRDHMNELIKRIAQNTLFRWAGKNTGMLNLNAANVVRTTGANTGHLLTGATGNRNKVLVDNLAAAKAIIVAQTKLVLNTGKRAFFMTEEFYTELLTDAVFANNQQYDKIGAVFVNGDLTKLLGFDIIRTDVMPRFDNSGTPVAKDGLDPTVANAATDNDVILAVDFDFVHLAKSDTKMFYAANDPNWQGDIMNVLARMGASRERVDQAGVAAIVQQ